MIKKNKQLITLMVLILTLAGCSSMPAGTGTKDGPILMVVTGEFTKAKMAEVLAEINGAKKYVNLDLSPMTGDVFNLEYLRGNGEEYIVSLKLPGAVTSIANYDDEFFYGRFPSLTSVTISNSVTTIGDKAFHCCYFLTSVTIPDSVISIGESAFYGTSLTSVIIPDSVTSIADYAFFNCFSLNSVTIGNSVTTIGEAAFYGPSLIAINVDATNTAYSSQDGVLYNKDKTVLKTYPSGKAGSFTIPNSVTSIGQSAFYMCTSLTRVLIPNSVTSIEDGAFCYCTSLASVTIPNSVTSIGESAFYGTSLTSVTIPNNVTSIGESAFFFCDSLTSLTFEGTIPSSGFNASSPFLGDLRVKFYATNPANGTPGTYTTTAPVSNNSVWTKQP